MTTFQESADEGSSTSLDKPKWWDIEVDEESRPDMQKWDFETDDTQAKWTASESTTVVDTGAADSDDCYSSENEDRDKEEDEDGTDPVTGYEQDDYGNWVSQWNDDSWNTAEWDISSRNLLGEDSISAETLPVLPVRERTFLSNSFRELHYFYNFVRAALEDSCRDAVHRVFGKDLTDQEWCRRKLIDPGLTMPRCRMQNSCFAMAEREWNEPGQIEMDSWEYFYTKFDIPNVQSEDKAEVFRCANSLRQAAVHRDHSRLSKEDLETAMQLPTILLDQSRMSEMEQLYQILLQEPSARRLEDQARFDKLIYTQDNSPVQLSQLLGQMQYLCECSAFEYAKAKDPDFLVKLSADCPERIELQEYLFRWEYPDNGVGQHPESLDLYPDPDGTRWPWRGALYDIKQLRNEATHRTLRVDPEWTPRELLQQRIGWAKTFARMVGDPAQADKMQGIEEEWLNKYRPVGEQAQEDKEMSAEESERSAAAIAAFDAEWEAALKG